MGYLNKYFYKNIGMKKILLAFDGIHFSDGAFDFARNMNMLNPVLLTGLFLPQVNYANLWSYAGSLGGPLLIPREEDEEDKVTKNIEHFESLCRNNDIDFRVRRDFTDLALPELKKESRFADLLIIGSESFYENIQSGEPNDYLKDTLHGVECPVIVVPEQYEFPKRNLLSYDGSESSVYAIKQFIYLFPELMKNTTLLVFAKGRGDDDIPEEAFIKELVARHFSDLSVVKLDSGSREEYTSWLNEKKAAILISGAFGRSAISLLLKKSFIADVIKSHHMPVFIAHR